MARHALLRLPPVCKARLEITLLGFAPVILVGLVACIALPGLLAATQLPWPAGAGAALPHRCWWMTHAGLAAAQALHPADVLHVEQAAADSAARQWRADAAVAGMIAGPLTLAVRRLDRDLVVSVAGLAGARRVASALLLTVLSLLLALAAVDLILALRSRMPAARKPASGRAAPRLLCGAAHAPATAVLLAPCSGCRSGAPRTWSASSRPCCCRRPCSASASGCGIRQVPPRSLGRCAALTLMLLTDRGDKAVREQIALLRPIAGAAGRCARSAVPLRHAVLAAARRCASHLRVLAAARPPATAIPGPSGLAGLCRRWPRSPCSRCVPHQRAWPVGLVIGAIIILTADWKRTMELILQIEGTGLRYANRAPVPPVQARLGAGITWLRGENGAGKTTLLKLAGGALAPHAGTITLDATDIPPQPLAYRLPATTAAATRRNCRG
jgi:hypothetical protein